MPVTKMTKGRSCGLKPPRKEIAKRKDDAERKRSIDAANAEIEADNKIADAAVEKVKEKAQKRADTLVDRYITAKGDGKVRNSNLVANVESLTKTPFGRQALLKACEDKGVDIEAYAEMLAISRKIGKKTKHPDSMTSRKHVTKSLETLHGVSQKEESGNQKPIINIIIADPFRNVENPRNTGYTVVNGESETPASGD